VEKSSNTRYTLLDGIRGICAFGIMFNHLWLSPHLVGFSLLVDLLFVLSGFVLYPALYSQKRYSSKKFIFSRILRIYPMLISVFVLYFLIYGNISFFGKVSGFAQPNLIETVGAFFLLQIFWGATIPVSTVLWSLSAEWFVNLLAVFTRKKIKVYLMLSLGFLLEILGLYINQKFQLGWQIFNYLIAIGRALVGFYLGLILRQSLKVKKRSFSLKRIIFVLFVFSINFYLLQKSIIFVIFSAPICYFIVREVVFIDEKRFPKLVLRFCRYLGRISYGVYLWHTIVGTLAFSSLILKFVPFTIEGYSRQIFDVSITILIVVMLTEIVIRFFEIPINEKVKSRLGVFRE